MSNALFPATPRTDVINSSWADSDESGQLNSAESGLPDQRNIILRKFCEIASAHVLRLRNRLQMIWAHTRRLSAKMVNDQLVGDGANEVFVRGAMGKPNISSKLKSSVSPLISLRSNTDPTRSNKPSIFFPPEIRSDLFSLSEISDMSSNVENMLTSDMPQSPVRHCCKWSGITTSTLTDPTWIRGEDLRSASSHPVPSYEWIVRSFLALTSRSFGYWRDLATSTLAVHGRILRNGGA